MPIKRTTLPLSTDEVVSDKSSISSVTKVNGFKVRKQTIQIDRNAAKEESENGSDRNEKISNIGSKMDTQNDKDRILSSSSKSSRQKHIESDRSIIFNEINDEHSLIERKHLDGISDSYFLNKTNRCSKQSDSKFFELLERINLNSKEFNEIVMEEHRKFRNEFTGISSDPIDLNLLNCLIQSDFNVIIYGYGSKIKILNEFVEKYLLDQHHFVVIKGFSKEISLRQVLIVLNRALENDPQETLILDPDRLIDSLRSRFQCIDRQLFIVIHSIDLLIQDRKGSMKSFLIKLLKTFRSHCHLIGSSDQANQEFLWSNSDIAHLQLHFVPFNTFEPYLVERDLSSFEQRIGGSNGWRNHQNFSSIHYVYESLNENAKKIFLIILKYFLEKRKNRSRKSSKLSEDSNRTSTTASSGLKFDELYRICREDFLASSVTTVRQHLTEFKDHRLLRFVKAPDGCECIQLCFEIEVAQKFVNSIDNNNDDE
ncbi:Origin recognition complex subunit 2 [Sarcoptes scabiei]|uniref:Origin recognition complex subunit 2 n=2 Tax=Sarcoptes scabiei TaxID=52283 RepID=A0A834RAF2_SARSC|nr:Origin recognition complex subunit 2 [Sarcoptes scabiei]